MSADQPAHREELTAIFRARGVAVVGASADPTKMGSVMARSLASFPGPVVLVNERAPDATAGLYPSVQAGAEALDATVDLVVLCVPAALCAASLERAAAAGVRAALVCAGGFAELGEEGASHQQTLLDVARRHGIRLLGPNTSGFIAPAHGLYATFVPGASAVEAGRVGVIAASGGVNHALAFLLAEAGHGVSVGVGLGNTADVDTADVIDYLAEDPETGAIALHVESVADGPQLLDAVRRASAVKPVVALVVGRADVGDFARSHTGALATAWRTTRAVLAQAGAVLVDDERELVDAVGSLSLLRLSPNANPGVALVTAQAGPGLLVMDNLRHHEVRLPQLSEETQAALGHLLPPMTYQSNPVDTGRPGASFADVLTTVAADPEIDLVATYALSEPDAVDLADAVLTAAHDGAVITLAVGGARAETDPVRDKLLAGDVPVHSQPSGLAVAVRAAVTDARHQHRRRHAGAGVQLPPTVTELVCGGPEWTEHDGKLLLDALGIETPRRAVCDSDQDAHDALSVLQTPVAVKLLDANVLHKTEVGGVHLGIRTTEELGQALGRLRAAGARRFLVEEMAPDGVDLIVGARRDPVFGPVVLLGLGGTIAESLADVTLRAAPLPADEARAMPDELLGRALLHGWRGGPDLDVDDLARTICLLGEVLVDHPQVEELEINPLRLTTRGLIALDAVVITDSSLRSLDDQPHQ
jgi:acyl-CoA synthetase (NDP forming)